MNMGTRAHRSVGPASRPFHTSPAIRRAFSVPVSPRARRTSPLSERIVCAAGGRLARVLTRYKCGRNVDAMCRQRGGIGCTSTLRPDCLHVASTLIPEKRGIETAPEAAFVPGHGVSACGLPRRRQEQNAAPFAPAGIAVRAALCHNKVTRTERNPNETERTRRWPDSPRHKTRFPRPPRRNANGPANPPRRRNPAPLSRGQTRSA